MRSLMIYTPYLGDYITDVSLSTGHSHPAQHGVSPVGCGRTQHILWYE